MKFPSGQGQYAAVVRRFELDQQLLTQAIKRDAVFLASTTVTSLSGVGDEAIILNLSNGQTVSASYLVAADGAYSSVRRMVGSQPTRLPSDWHAFRQYFPLASDPREIFVSFEEDLLPAYLWQFPLADGATNIGFGMHLGVLSRLGEMNSIWKDIQSRPHLRELFERPALERLKAWPIPAHISQIELSIGRVLFVGDAAAASDALSGEGIGQALETGQLVAKAIVEGGPLRSERVRNNYESSVHRALDRDHRWSSLLMRGLSHRRGARGGVRISGSNDWLGTIMARWMFEDIPRSKILSPLSVLGTRRGAFS